GGGDPGRLRGGDPDAPPGRRDAEPGPEPGRRRGQPRPGRTGHQGGQGARAGAAVGRAPGALYLRVLRPGDGAPFRRGRGARPERPLLRLFSAGARHPHSLRVPGEGSRLRCGRLRQRQPCRARRGPRHLPQAQPGRDDARAPRLYAGDGSAGRRGGGTAGCARRLLGPGLPGGRAGGGGARGRPRPSPRRLARALGAPVRALLRRPRPGLRHPPRQREPDRRLPRGPLRRDGPRLRPGRGTSLPEPWPHRRRRVGPRRARALAGLLRRYPARACGDDGYRGRAAGELFL
ncbi:MAG: hypothetical protein AVDCRST_MAG02-3000, partial [uncultured Rubrobacteraceae bacterium]